MIISVPTIMHSGTHILREVFKDFDKEEVVYSHLYKIYAYEDTIVTCLRHPARVFESFRRRENHVVIGDIVDYWERTREQCITQWDNMINSIAPKNPYYVHIDCPKIRDKQIKRISELTGKNLSINWDILYGNGSKGTHDFDVTNNKEPQEYIDFYYETQNDSKN